MKRFASLDAYRGLAVALMLFFSFMPLLSYGVPRFLLHNQGNGLLFGDLVAPMFQFMVGVSLAVSVAKRRKERLSEDKLAIRATRRFALILLLGIALDAVTYMDTVTWGVLETIGVSGIIALLLKDGSDGEIALFSVALLTVYGAASTQPMFIALLWALPHGGPLGAFSYTVMTLAGLVVGRHLVEGRENFQNNLMLASIALMLVGAGLSLVVPFNKLLVSVSFSVFATGAAAFFFSILYWLFEERKAAFAPLADIGRRALTVWVMQYFLVFWPLYFIAGKTNFLPFEFGAAGALVIIAAFYFISGFLERHGLRANL